MYGSAPRQHSPGINFDSTTGLQQQNIVSIDCMTGLKVRYITAIF
jgi:hypothetical protein